MCRKMNEQLSMEESQKLEQKYGMDWMCTKCTSSMHIVSKLIRHPEATKESFPIVLRCISCNHEYTSVAYVENQKWLIRYKKEN